MTDSLQSSLKIAGAGLEAQSLRLRIISENIANAQSTASTPGGDPYTRQTIAFGNELDRASGLNLVQVKSIGADQTPFRVEHDPGNPAADANGFVKLPNVELLTELADMREANRSYEANLQVAKQSADLQNQTLSLMKDA
ncbi:MAG: flagellar basal body rod protein FlgC [Hyphomicrobiales bacterium]|nr:flagellar basal body rod protein FlgC [Hyphomicrobiales bacterium]MBV8661768.1 flagellar basal body rod protein FlgC [Hyphomicrobiales bacterium]